MLSKNKRGDRDLPSSDEILWLNPLIEQGRLEHLMRGSLKRTIKKTHVTNYAEKSIHRTSSLFQSPFIFPLNIYI